ncbi:uncharacterized protein LOC110695001 [Chenopodium quinoa]|uniref:uncharacterized protein LOC110695001 n=1 Tax=Chenopodium quinoa TaxID=63459 RepID=UPI000B77A505|nr:uncharacterized protein LOC110695001 [Chenopodium quinoa]
MQGETILVTVECLRGRLQAERAASRAAEQNVDLLAIKLSELEKQLKIETKYRRKAEKKLNILIKKLESLNIPKNNVISEEYERLSSSNNSEISCLSSIISTSFNPQEYHLPAFQGSKSSSISSEIAEENTESEISAKQKGQDIIKCERSQIDHTIGRQEMDENCHGLKQLSLEKSNNDEIDDNQDNFFVDNSLTLVPMSPVVELNTSSKGPLEVDSENVKEVLDTLKQIRENLQSSIRGKGALLKVG